MRQQQIGAACRQIVIEIPTLANIALPRTGAAQFFVPRDQALVAVMPATHDVSRINFAPGA
jgi:hypothetical protein